MAYVSTGDQSFDRIALKFSPPQPQGVSLLNYVNAATFIFDLFSLLDSTLGHICGFVFLFFIRGFMVIDEKVGKATSSLESLRV